MRGGDAWVSLGGWRAQLRRAVVGWALAGLAAGGAAADQAAATRPHDPAYLALLGPTVCAAPGPDLFRDDFESGEGCRWSLSNPADPFCPAAVCGDGLQHAGEACDDGNTTDETSCAYGLGACTCCAGDCAGALQLTGPYCGDSQLDAGAGEVCDDGNTVTETDCAAYGFASCLVCNRFCTEELTLTGHYCGDGALDADFETCDDGNLVSETQCPYGTPTCTRCSATCLVLNLTGGVCGDGAVDSGFETCDDGNTLTETACPYGQASCSACSADCQSALALGGGVCGDGLVDPPWESCDDGNVQACGTCSADCRTAQVAAATGYLVAVAGGQLADGETVTLDDGFLSFDLEFDFDDSVTPGSVPVTLAGNETAGQVGARIETAINLAPGLVQAISLGSALVHLVHQLATSRGNQLILDTVNDPEFEAAGLVGGQGGDCPAGVGCASGADCYTGNCDLGICLAR